jgi:flagellar biosynthesis/type III secretory pathway M-ring protein FliF/YscJ
MAVISIILLTLIGVSVFYYYNSKQPADYVIFASSQNLGPDLREALIIRLEKNKIPYQIDNDGNVKIPENKTRQAVMCCS